MKYLAGLLLVQFNVIALGFIVAWGGGLITNEQYRLRMISADFEREACVRKHTILLDQIKKEGLFKRLGLNAQPWLAR